MSEPNEANPTGDDDASQDALIEAVYEQLRAIAQQRLRMENPGHTLQATALVHEAFVRIGRGRHAPFKNNAHFFAAAAEAMRRILIDHARAKGAAKRGGKVRASSMSVLDLASDCDPSEIVALDQALERLESAEPEVAAVVRMRFYAGLSGDATAEALGISARQVDRLWAYARAWLARELTG